MKLFQTLLFACFLLITASAVGAAETAPALDEPTVAEADVQVTEADVVAPVKKDCEKDAGLFQSEWMSADVETGLAPQSCGSCSTSNCNGAIRGQACWTGNGWGHCNIYSGGYRCSTGGWECQCGVGPLP